MGIRNATKKKIEIDWIETIKKIKLFIVGWTSFVLCYVCCNRNQYDKNRMLNRFDL